MNYQRFMTFLAGPISIAAGYGAALAVRYLGPLGGLYGKAHWAGMLTEAITFAVGAGVTYLAHQKWFTNLAAWWQHQNQQQALELGREQQQAHAVTAPRAVKAKPPPAVKK